MRRRGPIRQHAHPGRAGRNKVGPPPGTSSTATGQSECAQSGARETGWNKAGTDWQSERLYAPPVLPGRCTPYVRTHCHTSTALTRTDTWRDEKEPARQAALPQLADRFRWWWQVMGSNHRRLSRRFYRPLLPGEANAADQRLRGSRRHQSRRRPPYVGGLGVPGSGANGRARTASEGTACCARIHTDSRPEFAERQDPNPAIMPVRVLACIQDDGLLQARPNAILQQT
jgi:hypothetical protein